MVNHINDSNFNEEVLNAKGVVVVDFFATWCAPCKMLAPVLEEVASEMGEVKVLKIDVDESPETATKLRGQNRRRRARPGPVREPACVRR